MSSGYRLELMKWGDGNDTLAYWDSMHGDDVVIVLTDAGAFERTYTEGDDGKLQPVLSPVDLTTRLRGLLRRLEGEESGQ